MYMIMTYHINTSELFLRLRTNLESLLESFRDYIPILTGVELLV